MQTIPDGYTAVTPWIISRDTDRVLAFISAAFGGVELARVLDDDSRIGHAEARIGDAVVMLFDSPAGWAETPAFLRVFVDDADDAFERAITAGGEGVTRPTELFWGDKIGRVRDPLGNVWWVQQRVADLTGDEIAERAGHAGFIDGMRYVQSSLADLRPTTHPGVHPTR
jgi:PhnB protein